MLRVILNMPYTDEITVSLQTNDGSAIGNDILAIMQNGIHLTTENTVLLFWSFCDEEP